MFKVIYQSSLKVTIDHSSEFLLNVYNRYQSEIENALYSDLLVRMSSALGCQSLVHMGRR